LRLVCYPTDRAAWGRLCRLLSYGQLEKKAPKGECHISLDDVARYAEGQVLIVLPPQDWDWREVLAPREAEIIAFGSQAPVRARDQDSSFETRLRDIRAKLASARGLYLAASHTYRGIDHARLAALDTLARRTGIPLLATGDVLYHTPRRRPLQDVLTAIRNHTTVAEAGLLLVRNAERHLKSPREMMRLMAGYEAAIARTIEVVEACSFSLEELRYEYPDEPVPPGLTPQSHLEALAREGARHRFPKGVPDSVSASLEKELALIAQLRYAPYFLTVHDIVAFACSKGILCQGRGSAANSVVCYCLGITNVDPTEIDLLIERFVSAKRS
jgi:error-prone DNA polymerase